MSFDKAVETALRTWYPEDHPLHLNPHHPLGKLLGEWGELLDDYMKSLYKPGYVFNPQDELGDIWYYLRILCYQKKVIPKKTIDYIVFPEIDTTIVFANCETDILITAAIYDASSYMLVRNHDGITYSALSLSFQCSVLDEIARRHTLALDDLTSSNWEKLKPGSERGEQWMKARVETEYTKGGKIGFK